MRPDSSFISQPIRSLQTMLRVISKAEGGSTHIIPDGIYGEETSQEVSAFQTEAGLPVTGITDLATWEAIYQAYEEARIEIEKPLYIEVLLDPFQVYRLGDESPYISLLQSMLISIASGNPQLIAPAHNGIFDSATSDAVLAFQHFTNLPETGELDRTTWLHVSKHFTLSANL